MRLCRLQIKPYLMLMPCVIFLAVFVCYGVCCSIVGSFQTSDSVGLTIENYQRLWSDQSFWLSLGLSLKIALLSTVPALVLGTILTRGIFRYFRFRKQQLWVWAPMLVPHFVAAYLIFLLLSSSGWISSVLAQLQLVDTPTDFPILVNDSTGIGIILTYLWKEIPFVVLMLLPIYYQFDPAYAQVVRTLGGTEWEVFRTGEWPWLFPTVMETGVILVAFIISAYEVPYLLGVTYPKMMAVLAYRWFYEGDWSNRPLALAAMVTVSIGLVVLAYLGFRWAQTHRYRTMRGR